MSSIGGGQNAGGRLASTGACAPYDGPPLAAGVSLHAYTERDILTPGGHLGGNQADDTLTRDRMRPVNWPLPASAQLAVDAAQAECSISEFRSGHPNRWSAHFPAGPEDAPKRPACLDRPRIRTLRSCGS